MSRNRRLVPAGRALAWLSWAGPILVLSFAIASIFGAIGYWASDTILGADFYAYHAASQRLIAGEGIYLPSLLSGEATTTGPWQYLYPPFLAQLLVPLAMLEREAAFLLFGICSITIFAASLAAAWRRAGGMVTLRGALVASAVVASYMPFYTTLFNGNVGLVIAGCASVAFIANPIVGAFLGGAFKVVPAALIAMTRRRDLSRRVIIAVASLAVLSLVASPSEWATYLSAALPATIINDDPIGQGGALAAMARLAGSVADAGLSGTLATDPALSEKLLRAGLWTSYLPYEWLQVLGSLEAPLRVISLLAALVLIVAGTRAANDPSRLHYAAASITVGGLLVPWTLWDHYLVALLPPAFSAWRVGNTGARARLAIGAALVSAPAAVAVGPYFWLLPSMFLLLDGIRRTRLPETLPPKRPMPAEQSERR